MKSGLDKSAQTYTDINIGSKWKLLMCCFFKVPPAEHANIQDPEYTVSDFKGSINTLRSVPRVFQIK